MKEFIEKLISRLENERERARVESIKTARRGMATNADKHLIKKRSFEKAIEIVNELAEEYSANTPQKSAGGWIPVTERLPEYDEESEYYEAVIVTLDSGRVTNAYYRNLDDEWWVNAGGVSRYEKTEHVIAWQSFPKAYGLQKSADWKNNLMNGFLNVE